MMSHKLANVHERGHTTVLPARLGLLAAGVDRRIWIFSERASRPRRYPKRAERWSKV